MKSLSLKFILVASLAVIFGSFQNCTGVGFENRSSQTAERSSSATSSSGNGDFYTGKPQHYLQTEASAPCAERTAAGKAFPNREIFFINGEFKLVRENCQDVFPPVVIPPGQVQANATTLIYQGRTFTAQNDLSEFQTIPPVCPSGRTVVNNSPANIALSPLDLLVGWNNHPDVQQSLYSSISALPLFQLTRVGPDLTFPLSENFAFKANTVYAFSFLIRAGSVSNAAMSFYNAKNGATVRLIANLNDGTAVLDSASAAATYLGYTSSPYGAGWNFTMFFNAGTNTDPLSDAGVGPWSATPSVDDTIYATAPTAYDVSTYCSP